MQMLMMRKWSKQLSIAAVSLDCMMSCHTQPDLQHMTTKFSNAAKSYRLQISITKTEVMYQPSPGKPYVELTITIDNLQLPITKQFKYLGSVLSNDAQMDEDIKARISKASSAYGRYKKGSGYHMVQN